MVPHSPGVAQVSSRTSQSHRMRLRVIVWDCDRDKDTGVLRVVLESQVFKIHHIHIYLYTYQSQAATWKESMAGNKQRETEPREREPRWLCSSPVAKVRSALALLNYMSQYTPCWLILVWVGFLSLVIKKRTVSRHEKAIFKLRRKGPFR